MLVFGSGYSVVTYGYSGVSLEDMRVKVARSLRDPDGNAFPEPVLDDFIRAATLEVSGVYPKELVETMDLVEDMYEYPLACDHVFRVEHVNASNEVDEVPKSDDDITLGWEVFAGNLFIPRGMPFVPDVEAIRVWGYAPRDVANESSDIVDVDAVGEEALRLYAMLLGYQALSGDRSLFTQWQALAGNTDITAAQLSGMIGTAEGRWKDVRRHLTRLRRI